MANDSTVKAGSWGKRTVEKILRIQETAMRLECPLFYLVDSAGARITDQVEMFPGRRGAGRIFYNQVQLSGRVPQICLLFGPSAAGGAYIPAFCDIVVMVDKNASMYLGSPRMAEMVIGEKVTLEEMGGAKMHTSVSGCGDVLVKTEQEAIEFAKSYFAYMPQNFRGETGIGLNGNGAPTTPEISLTERFTRVAEDRVDYSVTVNDPGLYTAPFTIAMPLTTQPDYTVLPYECHEGNHALPNILSAARAEEGRGAN